MSRSPDREGVEKLLQLVSDNCTAKVNLEEVDGKINELVKKKNELLTQISTTNQGIVNQLDEMDCRANGNIGWEKRIIFMLGEFYLQAFNEGAEQGAENN